jgi:hypothetical protein
MEAVIQFCLDPHESTEQKAYFDQLHELLTKCIHEYNDFATELTELETITNIAKNKNVPNAGYYCERIMELKDLLPKYKEFLDSYKDFCNNPNRETEELIEILASGAKLYYGPKPQ